MASASPSGSRSRSPSSTPPQSSSPPHPGVPAKRKLSHASHDGALHLDRHPTGAAAQQAQAHKAYISKTAPHLRRPSPGGSTPERSGTPGSRSSSARASPFSDADEVETQVGASRDRGAVGGSGSGAGTSNHHKGRGTPSLSTPPTSGRESRHAVPKGFRGPLPRFGDAEDIAPPPALLPTPGSTEMFQTTNFPVNRNGWRYTPAGPSTDQLPQSVFKTLELEPRGVHWSWSDRSIFTKVSHDASVVGSDRGFRSARANVPVREGAWYVEIHVLPPERLVPGVGAQGTLPAPMSDGPHVRLGWGRREAGLNAPAGADGFSYGIRDATGEKVFLARPAAFAKPFGPGDVVGMYIRLPPVSKPSDKDPWDPAKVRRKRIPIRYRGQLYFETLEYAPSKEMEAMMERSRKGVKMNSAGVPLSELSGPGSGSKSQAGEEGDGEGAPATTATTKKRRGLKSEQEPEKPAAQTNLRPLVTLGAERSRIGFFINGQPQGTAFTDLLDFRPLRRALDAPNGAGSKGKAAKAAAAATSIGLANGDVDDLGGAAITSNSSVASIMKSRENAFDDGTLGYFPFVSCFGGARARIVASRDEWSFEPPLDIEGALAEVDVAKGGPKPSEVAPPPWRPLSERFDEFLQEMWRLDVLDEERAQARAALRRHEEEDEEEEGGEDSTPGVVTSNNQHRRGGAGGSSSKSSAKSRKATSSSSAGKTRNHHLASASPRDTASPAPLPHQQLHPSSALHSSGGGGGQAAHSASTSHRFDSSGPASPATPMEWEAPPDGEGQTTTNSSDGPLRSALGADTAAPKVEEEEDDDEGQRMELG